MRSLREQFILSHILPFMLILPLAGLVIVYLIEAQVILGRLSDNLEERAVLIAEAVAQRPELLSNREAAGRFIEQIGHYVDGDIYLLAPDGSLIAGNQDPEKVDELPPLDGGTAPRTVRVATSHDLAGPEGEAVAPVVDINEQIIGIVAVRESIEGLAEAFSPLRRLVLVTVLAGMLMGAVIGSVLARRLEEPISRTSAAVSRIAAGAPGEPLAAQGPRELRQLTDAVNQLAAKLRALEEMRRRSFANITHELGRPLGAVLAAVQVLRGDAGQETAIRGELLEGVYKELKGMEPLLDELSQLHADATGGGRLDRQVVGATDWLTAALPAWREAALSRGLTWQADIPPDLPYVNIDKSRMTQVLGNLLSNAIKFTTEGGVTVSAYAGLHEIEVAVSDTGPGIAPQDLTRIFEPFYRGSTPERTTEGLGVGLTIAKSLVEAHGGRLSFESATGSSCTFKINLPTSA